MKNWGKLGRGVTMGEMVKEVIGDAQATGNLDAGTEGTVEALEALDLAPASEDSNTDPAVGLDVD